jgi:hypothetical protein
MRMLKTRSRSQLLGQAIARKFSCIRKAECSWVLTFSRRFCGQDEEHDPGEEFEEWLACAVCGDNGKCPHLAFFEETQGIEEAN